ncbi:hypothetical protein TPHA_0I00540 [Tetrapisispora phaffii CBS 4417]|uniref:F-box domain-containing protein n=1 Tax=Tetrapisispora phaffii (strain ATCC 24235 / CBS 4417 / NBRC 1672 / NRRL Y-8282 / UCD 70-5) TaxID=1071381 RepID=G8BXD2_TETPH|nr:hypothetical protein TPHA_0I00540 [Tetrapisispora phaffii CBS 4417]CCE64560.1 hypothetical protein TPHA_0I00540 [Tetrapisispora phaffii CBS 4417]
MVDNVLIDALRFVVSHLNQHDLLTLSTVSKEINEKVVKPQLYKNIIVLEDPIIRSSRWAIDCDKTYVSGFNSVIKTKDQNDIFLYDKIQRLLDDEYVENLKYVKTLLIAKHSFNDKETSIYLVQKLITEIIKYGNVESLKILDPVIFHKVYLKSLNLTTLKEVKLLDINDITQLKTSKRLKSITIDGNIEKIAPETIAYMNENLCDNFSNLQELLINNKENGSLRFFQIFSDLNISFKKVGIKKIKFSHMHSKTGYESIIQPLTIEYLDKVFDLSLIKSLDISIGCENDGCDCLSKFYKDLSNKLLNLQKLSVTENTLITKGDHVTEEKWDILLGRFLLSIPHVSTNLKELNIRHNPPLDGDQKNSVDGNYFRRRDLYKEILLNLRALKKLTSPTILLTLSCYDILIGDLLWNGCTCEYCQKVLPILDNYCMKHLLYLERQASYIDISVTNFFAYVNRVLNSRFSDQIDSDFEIATTAPMAKFWNLHGFDNIRHFEGYECKYNETVFQLIPTVVTHFFDGYMDTLVQILPNLEVVIFAGIYYEVDPITHEYDSIYD